MKKTAYKAAYRRGLMGESVVLGADADEAKREAFALCRLNASCIPDGWGPDDVLERLEPFDGPAGQAGYGFRPTVEEAPRKDLSFLEREAGRTWGETRPAAPEEEAAETPAV